MRIALITDAWRPQVNGVVRTWTNVARELEAMGHVVQPIHPGQFFTIPTPRYPEIRLAISPGRRTRRLLDAFAPEAIHIATEGPLGVAGRRYCVRRNLPFTTSYHTQYPAYIWAYFGIPAGLTYSFLRWFHGGSQAVLTPTRGVAEQLNAKGITNTVVWSRGVDTAFFKPEPREPYPGLARPIHLYAGRVAFEKNIEAFLNLDVPGSKVVVGDGPAKAWLEPRHTDVHWAGYQFGEALSAHYAGADVFVFPSRTDTFGVVMLEANACGLPVAAYPVTGPIDVVKPGVTGFLDEDLQVAAEKALQLDRAVCRREAETHSWHGCAQIVLDHLAEFEPSAPRRGRASRQHAKKTAPART